MFQRRAYYLAVLLLAFAGAVSAQTITATPGTYELVAGSSMQFDGRPAEGQAEPVAYQWEIFSGEGASLVDADSHKVTFVAPAAVEETRSYTLQLTLTYDASRASSAQVRVRVHPGGNVVRRRSSPWVGGTIGFGFGYLWGGWWGYPPLIVIPCPPPGIDVLPEDLEPVLLPLPEDPGYDDWLADHPEWADLYDEEAELPASTWDEEAALELEQEIDELELEAEAAAIEQQLEDEMDSMPEPVIEPEPADRRAPDDDGFFDDGGYDDGGYDDGGYDDGGFDDGGFDDGGFDLF